MAANLGSGGLTPEELAQFEEMLRERRRQLTADVNSLEAEDAQGATETTAFSTHLADLGSDSASSDISLGRREAASEEIQGIDEALERIQAGTFGVCDSCEKPIVKSRLEAIPYASLCIPCKQLEEGIKH
jgi:DnaK suppressor protein